MSSGALVPQELVNTASIVVRLLSGLVKRAQMALAIDEGDRKQLRIQIEKAKRLVSARALYELYGEQARLLDQAFAKAEAAQGTDAYETHLQNARLLAILFRDNLRGMQDFIERV